MRCLIIFLLGLISVFQLPGQTAPGKYWVQFTDKLESPYSVDRPGEFLTQRSIDRRERYSIAINEQDLPVNPAYVEGVRSLGARILNRSRWFNAITVETADTSVLQKIRELPFVRQIKSVARLHSGKSFADKFEVSGELASQQVLSTDTTLLQYGLASRQIGMLNGHILHNQGFQGQGMVIAILDGGFRNVNINRAFDSVRLHNQILGGWDFVLNQPIFYDQHAHGAQVMSIMTANLPGQLVGTAPKASYYLLRTEDAATEMIIEEDNWVSGAEFADSVGADLINSSLGYSLFDNPAYDHTYSDMDGNTTRVTRAADLAAARGILVVNSAGNEGNTEWHYITAPADGDSVLAVGSVDSLRNYSRTSSTGPTFDRRVKPNVTAQGSYTAIVGTDGNIYRGSGTSFSSPLICGLAACLWQSNRSVPPMKIIEAIQSSASQSHAPDSLKGYGIPDFGKALFLIQGMNPVPLDDESMFRVYPNPFTDQVSVDFYSHDNQKITLLLMTVTGQVLYSTTREVGHTSLNRIGFTGLGSLPDGMYWIGIRTNMGFHHKKIMRITGS